MTTVFLVLFFIFIILLIIIMFLLLKRLIFKVNQQSMDYFVDKLKVYDNLINEKEKKMDELNGLIENKAQELNNSEEEKDKNNQPIFLYDLGNVIYKDKDIFKKMKDVDKKFTFDNKEILMKFFQNTFDTETVSDYNRYYRVRKKFTQDVMFSLMTKKKNVQREELKELLGDSSELLDDFIKSNKVFDLKKFISYLNKVIDSLDPHVYVYVGDKNLNYDNLNEYIKTVFDDSIFRGFKIIYRGKLYDYSL